jgi:hypothetical protein
VTKKTADKVRAQYAMSGMIVSARNFPISRRRASVTALVFLNIYILGYLLQSSFSFNLVGPPARFYIISIFLLLPISYFTARAFMRVDFLELSIFVSIAALSFFYLASFSAEFNTEMNANALAWIYGVVSFIVFYQFIRSGQLPLIVNLIFYYAMTYTILYLVTVIFLISETFPRGAALEYLREGHIVLSDVSRGDRLFLVLFMAGFAYLYCLARIRDSFSFLYLILAAIALAAIVLSLSRAFIAVTLLISCLYIVRIPLSIIKVLSFSLFLAVSSYLIYCVLDPLANPYSFSAVDDSTIARRLAFEVARYYIMRYPILGAGYPNEDFTRFERLSPGDLGPVGIWFMFGLVGLVLYVYSVYICCFQKPNVNSGQIGARLAAHALTLTGCGVGLYACIGPEVWFDSGPIFFGIALASRLNALSARRRIFMTTAKRVRIRPRPA